MTEIRRKDLKEVTGGENAIYGGVVGTQNGGLELSDSVNITRSVNENAGAITVGTVGGVVSNVTGSVAMGDSVNINLIDSNAGALNVGGVTGTVQGSQSIIDCRNIVNPINGGSL